MHRKPKLHNAMWPGLVGKASQGGDEPDISLDRMLELTAAAEVNGTKFDGIDYFLFHPHTDPDASEDDLRAIADKIAGYNLSVGSLVAPIWPGTVGASSMTNAEDRKLFVLAVEKACRIAKIFNEHGVRKYGVIRIDSADQAIGSWAEDPAGNTKKIAGTFKEAAKVAADHGERLAAEGEVCWCGMHSWRDMLNLLEAVGMPETLGFQADLAHTYLYLMGVNAPEHALLSEGYTNEEFHNAYEQMTDALRPWTIDFHVAQNDGTVHGSGSHDKTGRHCPADDPNGKLNIVECSKYWLKGAADRGIEHICWDGCMFPNAMLEDSKTWNTILATMIKVREAHGWAVDNALRQQLDLQAASLVNVRSPKKKPTHRSAALKKSTDPPAVNKQANTSSELNPALQYGSHILHADYNATYERGLAASGMLDHVMRRPRFFHLVQMLKLTAGVNGAVVETGVFRGLASFMLCNTLREESANQSYTGKRYFIVDSFEGLSEPVAKDGDHSHKRWEQKAFCTTSVETVRKTLAEFPDVTIIKGWVPEALQLLPEQKYRFVHIDVDLYQPTIDSLDYYWSRMAYGGMIVIDDYGPWPEGNWPGCAKAVHEFSAAQGVPFAALDTGNVVLIKR